MEWKTTRRNVRPPALNENPAKVSKIQPFKTVKISKKCMAIQTSPDPMSDSSLWLLSNLKSAPTLHIIYYAIFETLSFIRFGSFSMFIEWYCIKRLSSSTLCIFLLFCVAIVISELFSAGAYFRLDFAAIERKKFAARYFWFKAKLKQKKFIFNGIR